VAAGSTPPPITVFNVAPAEAGLRIDAFLVRRSMVVSVAAARRLLAETGARVDGRRVRKGERLVAGQTIELVQRRKPTAATGVPALEVLYSDDDLVAMAKPAGVACHPLREGEAGTLADALVARYPECARAGRDAREAGLAHRLDTGTSGVIVAARRPEVHRTLRQLLSGGDSEKIYLAEVVGRPAGAETGGGTIVVDIPIGRQGRRGSRVILGGGRGALPARTEFCVLRAEAETALIEARLSAGRAHQVRAHLAHLGSPILGDRLYGDASAAALATARGVEGFHLHAWRLRLTHPTTGKILLLEAPPPAWAASRQEAQESA
jgi:23S rRNA pseudouridine1911/1915/1917 synthase